MSKVPAHWDLIGQVAAMRTSLAPDTLIVGNGDAEDHEHGQELAKEYRVDGVMIGRGIFKNPFVFDPDGRQIWQAYSRERRIALYRQQVQLFADTWRDRERNIKTLNKFCKVYISDFDGAKELREQLMAADSTDELLQLLDRSRDTMQV